MCETVVVLDLNGVIADIRRREAAPVSENPDVILPNGQKAYFHPSSIPFLMMLLGWRSKIQTVFYTSRTAHNAKPVEDYVEKNIGKHLFSFIITLHGEDCLPPVPSAGGIERFHPIKTVNAVISRCPTAKRVIFMDDHPNRIQTSQSSMATCMEIVFIRVGQFDASKSDDTKGYLKQAAETLLDVLTKKMS